MGADQTSKTETAPGKVAATPKIPHTRSPNFPALSLRKSVEKTESLYKAAKKFSLDAETALKHLGHNSIVSSNALQTVGALKAFGLIDTEGAGKDRKIGVSEVG